MRVWAVTWREGSERPGVFCKRRGWQTSQAVPGCPAVGPQSDGAGGAVLTHKNTQEVGSLVSWDRALCRESLALGILAPARRAGVVVAGR